jgi:hypothetical protein
MKTCEQCGEEYSIESRRGKPGLVTLCNHCANEITNEVIKYTGNMIYDHKTGCSIQINADPGLTAYITNSTKLRNKGSNLGNNLKVSYQTKGEGRCIINAGSKANAKGKL